MPWGTILRRMGLEHEMEVDRAAGGDAFAMDA